MKKKSWNQSKFTYLIELISGKSFELKISANERVAQSFASTLSKCTQIFQLTYSYRDVDIIHPNNKQIDKDI